MQLLIDFETRWSVCVFQQQQYPGDISPPMNRPQSMMVGQAPVEHQLPPNTATLCRPVGSDLVFWWHCLQVQILSLIRFICVFSPKTKLYNSCQRVGLWVRVSDRATFRLPGRCRCLWAEARAVWPKEAVVRAAVSPCRWHCISQIQKWISSLKKILIDTRRVFSENAKVFRQCSAGLGYICISSNLRY